MTPPPARAAAHVGPQPPAAASSSSSSLMVDSRWIDRHVGNDRKLRPRERYRRRRRRRVLPVLLRRRGPTTTTTTTTTTAGADRDALIVVPDGPFLRRYLRLLEDVTECIASSSSASALSSSSESEEPPPPAAATTDVALVLLESAAESMDRRNASPCDVVPSTMDAAAERREEDNEEGDYDGRSGDERTPDGAGGGKKTRRRTETAAPDERNRVLRLADGNAIVMPFADLTYSEIIDDGDDGKWDDEVDDEFDLLSYPAMSVEDRSRRALLRAGRMLLSYYSSSSSSSSSGEGRTKTSVLLLTDDANLRAEAAERVDAASSAATAATEEGTGGSGLTTGGGVRATDCDGLLECLSSVRLSDETAPLRRWRELKVRCEQEYADRNAPPSSSSAAGAAAEGHGGGRRPYLSDEEVRIGLREGRYRRGKLDVTRENPREGYVSCSDVTGGGAGGGGGGGGGKKIRYYLNDEWGHFNRSLHGDAVIVEPLPESLWGRPKGRRRLVHAPNQSGTSNTDDDDDGEEKKEAGGDDDAMVPAVPTARVVALRTSSSGGGAPPRRKFVATLVHPPSRSSSGRGTGTYRITGEDSHILVVPMDPRIPKVRIRTPRTDTSSELTNHRLLIEVDGWDLDSKYPHGHYVETVGPAGELEVEIRCLLIEHRIDNVPFSRAAMACLPGEGREWTVTEGELAGDGSGSSAGGITGGKGEGAGRRKDLRRARRIFSVDPPSCQDIDDAMHAHRLPNGDIEIGVHIADVTRFVPHNSALDREARERSTTFYLVDRRFDMLPSLLSSDLCSLHGNVDRLAVSVIWTFSPDLKTVKDVWYGRTVIHNCAAMTYDQADRILQDLPPEEEGAPPVPPLTAGTPVNRSLIPALKDDLTVLTDLARTLRTSREDVGGAVDLSSGDRGSELKFTLDPITGNPTRVKPKTECEIHRTIAELMILANRYVAERIHDFFPSVALLRVHRPVDAERFEELEGAMKGGGMGQFFDGRSNMALARTLKTAREATGAAAAGGGGGGGAEAAGRAIDSLFQSLATRAMSEAQYVCTGASDVPEGAGGGGLSHYGLGIERYTHFTSPIRRYADVVVHRLLLASLEDRQEGRRSSAGAPDALFPKAAEQKAMEELPDSKVMSVLGSAEAEAEAEAEDEEDEMLDLIEGAAEMALGDKRGGGGSDGGEVDRAENDDADDVVNAPPSEELYQTSQVSKICDRLNHQTRQAKLSSMECQRLFLSLYFRRNVETSVPAVIVGLRSNGLLVYVPKFDLKGPVFLSDRDGVLQIDPSLVGMMDNDTEAVGLPPTAGFAVLDGCRAFPDGRCTLIDDGTTAEEEENKRLEVSVPGAPKTCTFRPLDVVSVQLSCETADVSARVPPPRLHLMGGRRAIARLKKKKSSTSSSETTPQGQQTRMTSDLVVGRRSPKGAEGPTEQEEKEASPQEPDSMFSVVASFEIIPKLDAPLRLSQRGGRPLKEPSHSREQKFPGRFVFGQFENPNTRGAIQEAAVQEAAAAAKERRAVYQQAAGGDYDATKRLEREATARVQRLAAEKRNARRHKAGR